MFRDEMEAALARAEAAERALEDLQAKDDASQVQIEALRAEVEQLRRIARPKVERAERPQPAAPTVDEEKAWRRARMFSAIYVVMAIMYLAALFAVIASSAAPDDPWSSLRPQGLSKGPHSGVATTVMMWGLLSLLFCMFFVTSVMAYVDKKPNLGIMDSSPLIIFLIVIGPFYLIPALWYSVKLFRHGGRERWLALVLLVAGLTLLVIFASLYLFELGD